MNAHRPGLCLIQLFISGHAAIGAAIISADFDSQPLGPLTTQLQSDPTPLTLPGVILRDSSNDRVDVANPVGDFTSKVMLIDSTPFNLASATFYNPTQFVTGTYSVSWDALITQAPVGIMDALVNLATEAQLGVPSIIGIGYDASGAFRIGAFELGVFHLGGTYVVGKRQHFEFLIDLDTHNYRLFIDGLLLDSEPLFGPGGFNLTSFSSNARIGTTDAGPFAVDNFKVELVPEASTLSLGACALGILGVMSRRRRAPWLQGVRSPNGATRMSSAT